MFISGEFLNKMPIKFDLEALREQHDCKVYFETGLYDPRNLGV